MRRPSLQSVSCTAPALGSPHTAPQRIQRIVTDNGACYRAKDFAHVLHGARHRFVAS